MTARAASLALLPLALLAAKDDPLAGRIAGPPADCIDLSFVQGPQIVDRSYILYRETGRRIWRTEPVGGCSRLEPMSTLVVEVYGNRLCRNDRFRVLRPGESIPGPSCRFGPFVPYTKPGEKVGPALKARSG